jgi:CBS domain-containing protein
MPTNALDVQREMLLLVTARVRDAYLRRPVYVEASLDLAGVCREMAGRGVTGVLVRDGERLGLFTTTDLRDAVAGGAALDRVPVRDAARFDLITVSPDCELFEALWLMERHRVHRLVVRDGAEVLGILAQLDLVSFVASHSHIVALQIDEATSVADLQLAAARVDSMIALLHDGGIKIERIARMVNELNARLFARLWSLLAPPELVANSCLIVMGSEGRGEQILKTDQDNALLLRDGFEPVGLEAVAARFNGALIELGYPPCPGDIMLTNPLWRQPLAAFREPIRDWLFAADPQGPMRLAIFFDATAVAGDASLLAAARDHLDAIFAGNDAFLARFASAVDQFSAGGGWWSWLTTRRDDTQLDLKKIGTFPIVHGVRVLALQQRLREVGTAARLRLLVEHHAIDADLARDLVDALHCFMGIKLSHQLRQRAAGEVPGNLVRPADLGALERDALTHAVAIVKRFRALLVQRFRLDAL